MENRIVITICGEEYALLADEAPSYMQKVGQYVDTKMSETLRTVKVGRTDAAVLTALNLADELMKSQQNAENLRAQLKGYIDDTNRAKNEISELKRELFRLQNQNRGGNNQGRR